MGAPEALGTFLPQLVAVYSVGRYSDARNVVVAAPLVLLGTAIQELKDPNFTLSGPTIFYWGLLAGACPSAIPYASASARSKRSLSMPMNCNAIEKPRLEPRSRPNAHGSPGNCTTSWGTASA